MIFWWFDPMDVTAGDKKPVRRIVKFFEGRK